MQTWPYALLLLRHPLPEARRVLMLADDFLLIPCVVASGLESSRSVRRQWHRGSEAYDVAARPPGVWGPHTLFVKPIAAAHDYGSAAGLEHHPMTVRQFLSVVWTVDARFQRIMFSWDSWGNRTRLSARKTCFRRWGCQWMLDRNGG